MSPRRGKGRLTEDEARQLRDWIADGTPDGLGLPFALWTSRAVRELIEQRFGKRLGLSTVPLYLQRWGMTPQKPLVRARERSPAAIAAWLERDYPAIAKRAKAAGAVIYWGDETGISNQDQIGRSPRAGGPSPRPLLNHVAGHAHPAAHDFALADLKLLFDHRHALLAGRAPRSYRPAFSPPSW